MRHYDYIIAGAGCAGLSLLMRLLDVPALKDKQILLADKAPKDRQDRTWCFWETTPGFFEPVVYRRWQRLAVHTPGHSVDRSIAPFTYKMIRGLDFYRYCFDRISRQPNVTIGYGDIENIADKGDHATMVMSGTAYTANHLFSSILPPLVRQPGKQYLLQHFRGRIVRMSTACFDPGAATLMDFRVPQQHGPCFMYVLPLTPDTAMVECTFFSPAVLPDEVYDRITDDYLAAQWPGIAYVVTEREQGVIPMTNHRFDASTGRVIYLGTAGGCTKPSSGYTFQAIQSQATRLAQQLAAGRPISGAQHGARRFRFYDAVLLRVLAANRLPAADIFGTLFRRNTPQRVLRFLDNSTGLQEEAALLSTLPAWPFLKAAVQELSALQIGSGKV